MIGPVLLVGAVLCALAGSRLLFYDGNPTGFIQFGQRTIQYSDPPRGALVQSPVGYDGQFYWLQANDPLLLHKTTVTRLRHTAPGYHLQRPAYPALSYLLAAGQRDAIPWTMLAANVLVVLAITACFARYALDRGWSPWWGLTLGLLPGFMLASLRDLSDPLAVASMLAGLLAWQRGRRWSAAILLAVAALAREPMTLAVVAIVIEGLANLVRWRRQPHALRRVVSATWPVVVVPTAAFLGWQLYIQTRYGSGGAATNQPVLPPFRDFVAEARSATQNGITFGALWDLAYLALMLAGIGAAVRLLRHGLSAASVAAVLFSVVLTVIVFGDQWGDSRYGLPLFALLLLVGLERRSRFALTICTFVAALTIFVPMAIPGG